MNMDHTDKYYDYSQLVTLMKMSIVRYDYKLTERAYNFAKKAHEGQKRQSGVPYILHPVSVASILVELGMDTVTIVAALLHDVIEDTTITLEDVKKEFGSEISLLIDGLTKPYPLLRSKDKETQAENVHKILVAMSKDVRVVIIKLADRTQNMRTIECMSDKQRRQKAHENLEIYAPIAHRFGLRQLKEELEDISLKYLDPIAYNEIENSLKLEKDVRTKFIELIKKRIHDRIGSHVPGAVLEGRVKTINGIYEKVFVRGKTLDEVYDVYAVRVIVGTIRDCYYVLGIVHDMFQPIPNRFKDYISIPKPNMYQSLHTTVISREGVPFEIQIRTLKMHKIAEYGIAAHWKYKLDLSKQVGIINDSFDLIKQIVGEQTDSSQNVQIASSNIIENIKLDLGPEEIYVLTPRGEVITLPNGSTVVDFAYAIRTEIVHKMIGCRVDKKEIPFNYVLKTGEIVDIITSDDFENGPNRNWLKFVKTSKAKNIIKKWLKNNKQNENIVEGKKIINEILLKSNLKLTENEFSKILKPFIKKYNCENLEDFYSKIGYNEIEIVDFLPEINKYFVKNNQKNSNLIVSGAQNSLIEFAECCHPVAGDRIVGVETTNKTIMVHRIECKIIADFKKNDENNKLIRLNWKNIAKKEFKTFVKIKLNNDENSLLNVTKKLSEIHAKVINFNYNVENSCQTSIKITLYVRNIEYLKNLMNNMLKVNNIISIKRV